MLEASSTTPCPQHHHPPNPRPVCGKIVFHKTSPWCQKGLETAVLDDTEFICNLHTWQAGTKDRHLTKYYLSLLFFPSSGFPWDLSILVVIFKGSTPSFTDHPYNFFFLWRLEDAGGGLVWCYNCLACWMIGFQFPSHSVPPASQFPSPVATNITNF